MEMSLIQGAGLLSFFFCGVTSITIIPATLYEPKQYQPTSDLVSSDLDLFLKSYPNIGYDRPNLTEYNANMFSPAVRSQPITKSSNIYPSQDSFVHGAIDAWIQSQHFVIRPENVWFTILSQLNLYLSSHQDDSQVRSNIEYQKNITFDIRGYIDRDDEAGRMLRYNIANIINGETRDRFRSPETRDWLQGNFSTSKGYEDAIIANLLLTGPVNSSTALFTSFNPPFSGPTTPFFCGMPSITLLGTQTDWSLLLQKLERLPVFGSQTAEYAEVLRPILSRFVRSFDDPTDADIRRFWDTIVRVHGLRGEGTRCLTADVVSGWINGFHYWDASGRVLSGRGSLRLDGVEYPMRSINNLSGTYTNTPLRERKNALGYMYVRLGELTAGMIGKRITNGPPQSYLAAMQKAGLSLPSNVSEKRHSVLEPISRWLLISEPGSGIEDVCAFGGFGRIC
jgi:hypothetical protein